MIDWQKITEIALTCIASVGGVGAIIIGVVKFAGDRIAERLSVKYQLQLDKEKERYKTELSKKEYVSKTRFETEFRMYQELSEKIITSVYDAGEASVIAQGAPYSIDELQIFIERFCNDLNETSRVNRRYAAFIAKEMYEKFFQIEKKTGEVFSLIKAWRQYKTGEIFSIRIQDDYYANQQEAEQAIIKKQKRLSDDLNAVIFELREYLGKLEVVEN